MSFLSKLFGSRSNEKSSHRRFRKRLGVESLEQKTMFAGLFGGDFVTTGFDTQIAGGTTETVEVSLIDTTTGGNADLNDMPSDDAEVDPNKGRQMQNTTQLRGIYQSLSAFSAK